MAEPLLYHLDIGGHALPARQVTGREAISEPFAIEVTTVLPDGVAIDPDAVVKSDAALVMVREAAQRSITAKVSEVFVMTSLTGNPELRVLLEPHFALSRYRQNIKAYLHKSVPDIVREVLGELGVVHDLRVGGYPVRPYTVQYRETDFHFVSRLLEEEGMFYFFDDAGTMIIGDGVGAYDDAGVIPFAHAAGADVQREAIISMGQRVRAMASEVALRDFNPVTPSAPMDVLAAGPTPSASPIYDYPGEYLEPGEGQRIANIKAAALACAAQGHRGRTTAGAVAPGRRFALEGAPPPLTDQPYVVTAVEHDFERNRQGYSLAFEALAEVAFKPLNRHAEPIVPNPLTGIVTGPAGEDIHTDEHGRVKVHFHWDRLQPYDDTCSHWVPVLQDNTGHSVQIPRIGWEVVVYFLEGDPDRPVVAGRVFNAEDPIYNTLPEKKTVTALRSVSSPGRDGVNMIELEDAAGYEHINFTAERDQDVVVAHDKIEHIMLNENRQVRRDETIEIGRNDTTTVSDGVVARIEGNQQIDIGGDRRIEVAQTVARSAGATHALNVGGSHHRRIGEMDSAAAIRFDEQVGGVIVEGSVKSNGADAGKAKLVTVGGAIVEYAHQGKLESATMARADTVGGVYLTKSKEGIGRNVADARVTNVGVALKGKATERIMVTAVDELAMQSATAEWTAETVITLEVGESKVTLGDGQLALTTPETITFELQDTGNFGASGTDQN